MPTVSSELRIIPKEQLTAWERWEMAALAEARAEEESATRAHPRESEASVAERDRAHAEGFRQGLEEGRKAGHAEGLARGRSEGLAQAQAHAAQLALLVQGATQAVASLQGSVSEGIVELALAIARQVVGSELAAHPESVVEVVRAALVQGGGPGSGTAAAGLHLRVHPDDARLLRECMAEDIEHGNWTFIEDAAMARGGCRLSDASGDIDASLPVRWQRVLAALGRDRTPAAGASA